MKGKEGMEEKIGIKRTGRENGDGRKERGDPSFTHSHSFLVMVDFSSFTPAIYVWEINFRKV